MRAQRGTEITKLESYTLIDGVNVSDIQNTVIGKSELAEITGFALNSVRQAVQLKSKSLPPSSYVTKMNNTRGVYVWDSVETHRHADCKDFRYRYSGHENHYDYSSAAYSTVSGGFRGVLQLPDGGVGTAYGPTLADVAHDLIIQYMPAKINLHTFEAVALLALNTSEHYGECLGVDRMADWFETTPGDVAMIISNPDAIFPPHRIIGYTPIWTARQARIARMSTAYIQPNKRKVVNGCMNIFCRA